MFPCSSNTTGQINSLSDVRVSRDSWNEHGFPQPEVDVEVRKLIYTPFHYGIVYIISAYVLSKIIIIIIASRDPTVRSKFLWSSSTIELADVRVALRYQATLYTWTDIVPCLILAIWGHIRFMTYPDVGHCLYLSSCSVVLLNPENTRTVGISWLSCISVEIWD